MKTKQLIISGFVSYAILEMLGMLFALFSGRLHTMQYEFTWGKFLRISVVFSISVGFLGAIIGYLFGKIQNRIPLVNIYAKSISYHVAINLLISFYKGIPYIKSLDFVLSFIFSIFIGWFFIWFYMLITKEAPKPIFNKIGR